MSDVLKDHQRQVLRGMFIKPGNCPIAHAALGLAGESGEVVDQIKKGQYEGRDIDVTKLKEELGDALWYWQYIAGRFGWTLEEIAMDNIAKLADRYPGRYTPIQKPDPKHTCWKYGRDDVQPFTSTEWCEGCQAGIRQ